jgi:hypothetical protein
VGRKQTSEKPRSPSQLWPHPPFGSPLLVSHLDLDEKIPLPIDESLKQKMNLLERSFGQASRRIESTLDTMLPLMLDAFGNMAGRVEALEQSIQLMLRHDH